MRGDELEFQYLRSERNRIDNIPARLGARFVL